MSKRSGTTTTATLEPVIQVTASSAQTSTITNDRQRVLLVSLGKRVHAARAAADVLADLLRTTKPTAIAVTVTMQAIKARREQSSETIETRVIELGQQRIENRAHVDLPSSERNRSVARERPRGQAASTVWSRGLCEVLVDHVGVGVDELCEPA